MSDFFLETSLWRRCCRRSPSNRLNTLFFVAFWCTNHLNRNVFPLFPYHWNSNLLLEKLLEWWQTFKGLLYGFEFSPFHQQRLGASSHRSSTQQHTERRTESKSQWEFDYCAYNVYIAFSQNYSNFWNGCVLLLRSEWNKTCTSQRWKMKYFPLNTQRNSQRPTLFLPPAELD